MTQFRSRVSHFFAVAALAASLAGCQAGESDATRMSGPPAGAMDKADTGKMDGAMDKMDPGKMESGKMDSGKAEGGAMGKMDAPKDAMEKDKMEGAPK